MLYLACYQGTEKISNFFLRDQKSIQFPFNPHVKYFVQPVNMFIQRNDVSVVVIDKSGYLCNDALCYRDSASAEWLNFCFFLS